MGGGSKSDGAQVIYICTNRETIIERFRTQVNLWSDVNPAHCRIWKLIPVEVEGMFTPSSSSSEALGSGSLPPYGEGATGQSSTRAYHAESERDDFGTVVTEVIITTTRKRYRVQDA